MRVRPWHVAHRSAVKGKIKDKMSVPLFVLDIAIKSNWHQSVKMLNIQW